MKKKLLVIIGLLLAGLFFCTTNVNAARTDMVDVSNHNGNMTVLNFVDMRNNYGVKSVNTKITEGTYYQDTVAANNIATAQAAGLYINGYHYAKYRTVSQAINEADFAGRTAKQLGLPIGAVLTADVEDPSLAGLTKSQMNTNNQAFMNEIAKFGYRSDVYTMGSWVNNRFTVNNGTGWIASYPYNASNKNWYSLNHGWQWGSTYRFQASNGNFDVSQLYDDFYTGNLPALVAPVSTINNVVSVKGKSYKAYSTYTGSGSANEGTDVLSGTDWKSSAIKVIAGEPYFTIGTNTYLKQSTTTMKGLLTINYLNDYGVLAYNSKGASYKDSNQTFKGGTSWQTDNKVYDIPNVGWCYKVSTDQYIPVTYQVGSGFIGD